MSTWGESENVQVVDIEDFDTWDVSKGSDDTVVLSVDDGWSKFLNVFSVSRFTSAGSHSSGGVDSFDIVPSAELLQKIDCLFCFFVFLSSVADDQWDFWNFVDFVAFSHDQSWYSSGGDGGSHSVSSLVDVTLLVPSSPSFQWSKHSTASAHVTKSSLAGSVGSASSDSRDSSYSSAGTPGFGGGLFTSDFFDSGSLSRILSEVGVHEVDEVRSDRGLEHGWGVDLASGFSAFVVDGDLWSRGGERHFHYFCKFDVRL